MVLFERDISQQRVGKRRVGRLAKRSCSLSPRFAQQALSQPFKKCQTHFQSVLWSRPVHQQPLSSGRCERLCKRLLNWKRQEAQHVCLCNFQRLSRFCLVCSYTGDGGMAASVTVRRVCQYTLGIKVVYVGLHCHTVMDCPPAVFFSQHFYLCPTHICANNVNAHAQLNFSFTPSLGYFVA